MYKGDDSGEAAILDEFRVALSLFCETFVLRNRATYAEMWQRFEEITAWMESWPPKPAYGERNHFYVQKNSEASVSWAREEVLSTACAACQGKLRAALD